MQAPVTASASFDAPRRAVLQTAARVIPTLGVPVPRGRDREGCATQAASFPLTHCTTLLPVRAKRFMNTDLVAGLRWSTSSFATDGSTHAVELSALGDHLELCKRVTGRLFALRCGADAVHRFVASRCVTTLVLATLLLGASLSL